MNNYGTTVMVALSLLISIFGLDRAIKDKNKAIWIYRIIIIFANCYVLISEYLRAQGYWM